MGEIKLGFIPVALAICFTALVILILYSGGLGQRKFEEIRLKSEENTQAYFTRFEVAIEIRQAAANTVAQVRLYRASKGLIFPGPAYKVNLNKAKHTLEKRLGEGRKLWAANEGGLPDAEILAWRKLESVTEEFWKVLRKEEEEARDRSDKAESAQQIKDANSDNAKDISTKDPFANNETNTSLDEGFFQQRADLEAAADELSKSIVSGLKGSQVAVEDLKNKAAIFFSGINWVTLIMGLAVIGFTIWLTQNYIKQVKQEVHLKQEARGQLRSVFDSLSNTIVVLSEEGEVLEVNQAFLKQFEVTD
ncbi:MAG: hypothetical protein L0220_05395, partial [Acidobacteria bacterium]|nr:hypothetical protein [Acidobacteriota bacterium]